MCTSPYDHDSLVQLPGPLSEGVGPSELVDRTLDNKLCKSMHFDKRIVPCLGSILAGNIC